MKINRKLLELYALGIFLLLAPVVLVADQLLDEKIIIKTIDAKNISNDEEGNLILEEDVIIITNLLEFRTDKAIYNQTEGTLELKARTEIKSSNLEISAQHILAKLAEGSFSVKGPDFNFKNRSFGTANELYIKTSGNVLLINANLTNCSKDDPAWQIEAKRIEIQKEGRNAIIRGIKFLIGDIPIFFFPYIRTAYGNERLSGFLSPSLRQGGDGIDLSLPYYFNLATNYDLEVSPRYIADRGSGGSSSFRYLSESFQGEMNLAVLFGDKEYEKEVEKKSKRWKTSWIHQGNIKNRLFTHINFKSTSDEYFFRDIGGDQFGESKTSYLPKKASFVWRAPLFKLALELSRYQILNPFIAEEYKSIPKIAFSSFLNKNNLSFSFQSSYAKFSGGRKNVFNTEFEDIERAYFNPEIQYVLEYPSSKVNFSIGSDILYYRTNSQSYNRSSPWIEATYQVFFEKENKERSSSLIPIIKYIYVENDDAFKVPVIDSRISSLDFNNLYRRTRYSGFERIPQVNKLIIGFEHTSLFKRTNYKDLSISLGQAFYFKKMHSFYKSKEIDRSPLVAEFRYYFSKNIWYSGFLEWDHSSKKINSGSFGYIYRNDNETRLELRSLYRRKNLNPSYLPWLDSKIATNQIELVTQMPIAGPISIFGRWLKDSETSKSLDILYGFQYSNCCLKIGLMKRKWMDEDYFSWQNNYSSAFIALSKGHDPTRMRDNIYLFIELKGLGRLGKKVSRIISSPKLE